jgi:DNA recombination protein RmuC
MEIDITVMGMLIGSAGLGALVVFLIYRTVLGAERDRVQSAEKTIERMTQQVETERRQREELEKLRMESYGQIQRLESEIRQAKARLIEYQEDMVRQEERFTLLADKVLDEKARRFDTMQRQGMEHLLTPLREKIKSFEERVENTSKESIAHHESLKAHIKLLTEQSERVSQEANSLTKALKGDFKKQGNWGEMILESVLDKSGLEKGREYFTQVAERDGEGRTQKPDVVIHLPDGKRLIIDSKVSLNAYQMMVDAELEEDANLSRKAHVLAVRNHIAGLSEKNYHDLYQMDSPDFVLMFIPIDTAFSAALAKDPELYNYAFDRNIVIVTPSTLLATLKTVETMWRNDKQNRYALEIATEAGKMYDKFVGFSEDLEKMGKQLNTVRNTYDDSMRKLTSGAGNLVTRAEKLKELGAKASKTLKLARDDGGE